MTAARQALGRCVEEMVAEALVDEGAAIVSRNARVSGIRGEIDLVALDRDVLVFVEVKGRTEGGSVGPERPALAVTARESGRSCARLREPGCARTGSGSPNIAACASTWSV